MLVQGGQGASVYPYCRLSARVLQYLGGLLLKMHTSQPLRDVVEEVVLPGLGGLASVAADEGADGALRTSSAASAEVSLALNAEEGSRLPAPPARCTESVLLCHDLQAHDPVEGLRLVRRTCKP